jgi:hypothetical protein
MENGLSVIGQVRKDTALFHEPERTGKRGRPRKYGYRVTTEWVASLPEVRQQFTVYGKAHRSAVVLARFLNGRPVRIVWSQLENEDGVRTQQSLILSTEISLSGARIILGYGRRWSVEDLFNQLKNRWGWKETWQQTRQVLHRWLPAMTVGRERCNSKVQVFTEIKNCSCTARRAGRATLPRGQQANPFNDQNDQGLF